MEPDQNDRGLGRLPATRGVVLRASAQGSRLSSARLADPFGLQDVQTRYYPWTSKRSRSAASGRRLTVKLQWRRCRTDSPSRRFSSDLRHVIPGHSMSVPISDTAISRRRDDQFDDTPTPAAACPDLAGTRKTVPTKPIRAPGRYKRRHRVVLWDRQETAPRCSTPTFQGRWRNAAGTRELHSSRRVVLPDQGLAAR